MKPYLERNKQGKLLLQQMLNLYKLYVWEIIPTTMMKSTISTISKDYKYLAYITNSVLYIKNITLDTTYLTAQLPSSIPKKLQFDKWSTHFMYMSEKCIRIFIIRPSGYNLLATLNIIASDATITTTDLLIHNPTSAKIHKIAYNLPLYFTIPLTLGDSCEIYDLHFYHRSTDKLKVYRKSHKSWQIFSILSLQTINTTVKYIDNSIFIGSSDQGLIQIDINTKQQKIISHSRYPHGYDDVFVGRDLFIIKCEDILHIYKKIDNVWKYKKNSTLTLTNANMKYIVFSFYDKFMIQYDTKMILYENLS